MNLTDKFNIYNLKNTIYDHIYCYFANDDFCGLNIYGDLNDKTYEHHHYNIYFRRININEDNGRINKYQNGILKDISVTENGVNTFDVHMVLENPSGIIILDFQCEDCDIAFYHYRGLDYTNVYSTDEYKDMINRYLYLDSDEYFSEENVIQITDEFSLIQKVYLHEGNGTIISMSWNFLKKNGKIIYKYMSVDNHRKPYDELIYHSNGHRYYPYHVDLYGISYIDVDTLERYDYIPRGCDNDYGLVCGESYIITKVCYDSNTNLVAYEGCYWGGTSDVMVGDLTNPLSFNPYLISIHELLDPDYEVFDDVDFEKWNENFLTVKIDYKNTRDVDLHGLIEELNSNYNVH